MDYRLFVHYNGPVSPSLTIAQINLRDEYTREWLASFNAQIACEIIKHDVASWRAEHNDTTPYYRTGGRRNYWG